MILLKGIKEFIDLIARQFAYFLKTAITFPILTSDPSSEDKRHSGSNEEIFGFTIACFVTVIFLVYLTDVLFNMFFILYDFLNLFPSSLSNVQLIDKPENNTVDSTTNGLNEVISFLSSFQFVVEILDLFVQLLIFITFFVIIVQILLTIIGILLFLLDLYVLVRKNITFSSLKKGNFEIFDLNGSDVSLLLFIGGLLIFPFFSVMLISYVVPTLFVFIYNSCFSGINLYYAGTFQIAHNMHQGIILMIKEAFSIKTPIGRIIRMIIGFFWMIIGLSVFSYDPSFHLNSININLSQQLSIIKP
ncbi:MAG: hypothetical protein ACFE95_18810, partial [Candidatus Hodarchaeota archaeon]